MSVFCILISQCKVLFGNRQAFCYPNGLTGSSSSVILIKNTKKELIRGLFTIRAEHCNDSARDRTKSKSITFLPGIEMYRTGCYRVIRGYDRRWVAVKFSRAELDNIALGFVKEGWATIEIKITLFEEREFDKKIAYVPKPLNQVPSTWGEPDGDKRIRESI